MTDAPVTRGLEGVVVTESELSYIDGTKGILIYRGYPIEELAEKSSFEELFRNFPREKYLPDILKRF